MGQTHQREAAIFDAALELPPEQRAAYLEHACGGDAALRQRIEALLKAGDSTGGYLDSPVDPVAAEPSNDLPLSFEKAGDRIGRYKLLQQIGEGGCGVVYMAEQEEPVSRRVALKVIKLGLDTKSVIARFEAERQALALMDHPNIAKVLDAGATETGRPYFVMELVRGLKITEYCDEARLPTNARLDLFIQVCQAIQHAHQKGIIHRDIKPSNILVTINDGVPVPKVIDFGIAKATGGLKLTNKTLFTAFEQFIGTPAYMSPEQAVLTSLDIDTRSDIYALGVLLYEMLTGKTPFDAQELLAIGLDEMRRTIREQDPPRPSTRLSTLAQNELSTTAQRRGIEAPKLVSELRGDLDWIVMKALEKDRARRYETANGLAMDIRRHLNHEPVAACPPSRLYRFRKTVRRNKLAFAAAAVVLLALVSGLALATWALVRERTARVEARTEATRSDQIARFLQDMLKSVQPSVALGRDTTMLLEILDQTAERIGAELKDQPGVEADLRNTIGRVYYFMGVNDKAEAMLRETLRIRRTLRSNDQLKLATTLYYLAYVLADVKKKEAEAESMLREALALQRKLLGNEHPDVASSLLVLGWALRKQGKLAEAEAIGREAVTMRKKLRGPEHPEVAESLSYLATTLRDESKLEEAETMFHEALAMQKKLLGSEHQDAIHTRDRMRWLLLRQGKLTEAEAVAREVLAIRRKLLGNEHPWVADSLNQLANVLLTQGKLAEAEAIFRELGDKGDAQALNALAWRMATSVNSKLLDGPTAVTLAEKAVAATNRKDPMILDTLAAAYAEVGQYERAVSVQQEAITLLEDEEQKVDAASRLKLYQSHSPYRDEAEVAATLAERTSSLLAEQKFAEVEPLARECLAIREKKFPDDWRTFNTRSLLGGSLLGQKQYAEAEPLLLAGYEGMMQREDKIPPLGRPRLKETLQRLVQLYEATGRPDHVAKWKPKLAEFEEKEEQRRTASARATLNRDSGSKTNSPPE